MAKYCRNCCGKKANKGFVYCGKCLANMRKFKKQEEANKAFWLYHEQTWRV